MAKSNSVAPMIVQSAYQAGPLGASMPVMNADNPSVAITIGIVVFNEAIATGAWHLAGAVAGVTMVVGGIVLLTTSPLIQRVQRIEDEEQEEEEEEREDAAQE